MATAECLNTECEKDVWELQKEPHEYSSDISCPTCGTTRVDVTVSPGGEQGPTKAKAAKPVKAEPDDQAGQELATPDQMGSFADIGATAAQMQTAPPEKQQQFKASMIGMIGDALKGYGVGMMEQAASGAERSKQHGGKIEAAEEYAECAECGGQIVYMPDQGNEFACPHCGIVLRV